MPLFDFFGCFSDNSSLAPGGYPEHGRRYEIACAAHFQHRLVAEHANQHSRLVFLDGVAQVGAQFVLDRVPHAPTFIITPAARRTHAIDTGGRHNGVLSLRIASTDSVDQHWKVKRAPNSMDLQRREGWLGPFVIKSDRTKSRWDILPMVRNNAVDVHLQTFAARDVATQGFYFREITAPIPPPMVAAPTPAQAAPRALPPAPVTAPPGNPGGPGHTGAATLPSVAPVTSALPALAAAVGNAAVASVVPPPDGGAAPDGPAAFAVERGSMCLCGHWLTFSHLGHCTEMLIAAADCLNVPQLDPNPAARSATMRGFGDPNANDDITGQPVARCLAGLHQSARSAGPQAPTAYVVSLTMLSELAAPDAVRALLSAVCDRAPRCSSAQHDAVASVITAGADALSLAIRRHAAESATESNPPAAAAGAPARALHPSVSAVVDQDEDDVDEAYRTLCRIFEDYVTDHKERAFSSAFLEPARCAFAWKNDAGGRDHVNVHGLNWGLPVFEKALGLAMRQQSVEDPHFMGYIDPWAHMTGVAWEAVWSRPEHFGKSFEGIFKSVKQQPAFFMAEGRQVYKPPPRVSHYRTFLSERTAVVNVPPSLMRFAHHIAYFFSAQFFIPKALAVLNSESKPEHEGFRKCVRLLFSVFKDEVLRTERPPPPTPHDDDDDDDYDDRAAAAFDAMDFDSYCYKDDLFTELDILHVRRFFAWLNFTTYDTRDPAMRRVARPVFVLNDRDRAAARRRLASRISEQDETFTGEAINEDILSPPAVISRELTSLLFTLENAEQAPAWSRQGTAILVAPAPDQSYEGSAEAESDDDNQDVLLTDIGRGRSIIEAPSCPICMEMCEDDALVRLHGIAGGGEAGVMTVDENAQEGDVMTHVMCFTCYTEHKQRSNTCPFCRRGLSEPSEYARRLTRVLTNAAGETELLSRDGLAEIFESWEAFELETAFSGVSQADVSHELRRTAALALTDPTLAMHVKRAVDVDEGTGSVAWLREAAAIFVRFHGLFSDAQEIPDARPLAPLEKAAAIIAEAAVTAAIAAVRPSLHSHELGSVYSQFLAALFAARTAGQATGAIEEVTRVIGDRIRPMAAVAGTRRVIRERVATMYITAANDLIWVPIGKKDPLM